MKVLGAGARGGGVSSIKGENFYLISWKLIKHDYIVKFMISTVGTLGCQFYIDPQYLVDDILWTMKDGVEHNGRYERALKILATKRDVKNDV